MSPSSEHQWTFDASIKQPIAEVSPIVI